MSAARRLAELDAERERLLEEQRREALSTDRDAPVALSRLASEMGVRLASLVAAARSGRLVAWRLGGAKRGELVTTRAELDRHLRSQPGRVERQADDVDALLKSAAERIARPKKGRIG